MLALALPDQVVGVGAVPVQPAHDADAIADADAPVAVGRVGGAASATSDPDAAVAVGRRLEAAVVVVVVLLLLLPLVVSGAVAPSLGRRAEAGEPSPASAPSARGARGARAVPVVVLPRPCPGGPGGRAPEVAPGAGAEERGGARRRDGGRGEETSEGFFCCCCSRERGESRSAKFSCFVSFAVTLSTRTVRGHRNRPRARRERGKNEAPKRQVNLSGVVVVATIEEFSGKKGGKHPSPYPSLCCTQCASKHAVQLTGDTSFVRRHSMHSSKGGRPLAPPPPGAPQEEQHEFCRSLIGERTRVYLSLLLRSPALCRRSLSRLLRFASEKLAEISNLAADVEKETFEKEGARATWQRKVVSFVALLFFPASTRVKFFSSPRSERETFVSTAPPTSFISQLALQPFFRSSSSLPRFFHKNPPSQPCSRPDSSRAPCSRSSSTPSRSSSPTPTSTARRPASASRPWTRRTSRSCR